MNVGSSQKKLWLLKLHSVLVKRSSIEPGNQEKNHLINENYGSGAINENNVQLGKTKRKIIRKSGNLEKSSRKVFRKSLHPIGAISLYWTWFYHLFYEINPIINNFDGIELERMKIIGFGFQLI